MQKYIGASSSIDYRLVLPERNESVMAFDIADPMVYLSATSLFKGYNFRNYASQIDCFPDDYFDVVMIDGRARPACIVHSASKVKLGGLLILDNAERSYYTSKTQGYLLDYACHEFYGAGPLTYSMWQTNIYVREG